MEDVLFLAHRLPFPPNKGDKIRSHNLLCHLAKRYRVHLGAFVDDHRDWRYVDTVKQICASTFLLSLNPRTAKLRALTALATGDALTVRYYHSNVMRKWVREQIQDRGISRVYVFSSAMAQFLDAELARDARSIIDFVDVDSEKWREYGKTHAWPLGALYRREARRLLSYDAQVAERFDVSLFVSAEEADLFKRLVPNVVDKVTNLDNGVDLEYFDPGRHYANPYDANMQSLVFTGAMDYWANVDAVTWFTNRVFPRVRERLPESALFVVGARPVEAVQILGDQENVFVTGGVYDIRPYLVHARAAVAPLRVARGVQNKVLEAMAMGVPVIATPAAALGIDARSTQGLHVGVDVEELVENSLRLLSQAPRAECSAAMRDAVRERYDWNRNLARLKDLFESLEAEPATPESVHFREWASAV